MAGDCRATTGEASPPRAGSPTVASVQFAMLNTAPGRWTQEDVSWPRPRGVRGREDLDEAEFERLRTKCLAQPRACLRASPLPKTYGWGLCNDANGLITLHAVDSETYVRLSTDPPLTQLRAMRSSRAGT